MLNFGRKGLRTLVFAMRELSLSQVNSVDWSSNDKEELASACETQLTVLGCTGVEDKLQEEVSECIGDFKDAGIKMWMLTGDLGHTAQEIGYNCGILSRDSDKHITMRLNTLDNEEAPTDEATSFKR